MDNETEKGAPAAEQVQSTELPEAATVEEVARYLRMNIKAVHEAIQRRELRASKRPIRIARAAVGDWPEGKGRVSSWRS